MTFLVSSTRLLKSSKRARHKVALKLLLKALDGHYASLSDYRYVESLLDITVLDLVDTKKVADRLCLHKEQSGLSITETGLDVQILTDDKESSTPYLDVHIVLNQLRSAFNVGSIMRTTESMRLGTLYFEGITPKAHSDKVRKSNS